MLIFVAIALTGFFFLLTSALFGDGDHDADAADADSDASGGGDHPSPFSLRVISLFMTAFGAAGAMTRLAGGGYVAATAVGTAAGAVVGFAGYKLIYFFMRQQSSSLLSAEELTGATAEVSVAIPADGVGQVNVVLNEKRLHPMARASAAGVSIEEGARVKIVRSAGNTVYVERA